MGLDAGFLSMLTATATLERVTGQDKWGNEAYGAPETIHCYIDVGTSTYGTGAEGGQQERRVVTEATVICDALGIAVNDRLTHASVAYSVTEVKTTPDEFGADYFQELTIQNQKKG